MLGGLVTQPSFLDAIGNPSPSFLGLIVALYNIGCLVGCIVASLIGNKWGRRKIIIWGCIIMIIGGVIQSAAFGAAQLIVGRLISGVGNGKSSTCSFLISAKHYIPRHEYEHCASLCLGVFTCKAQGTCCCSTTLNRYCKRPPPS